MRLVSWCPDWLLYILILLGFVIAAWGFAFFLEFLSGGDLDGALMGLVFFFLAILGFAVGGGFS